MKTISLTKGQHALVDDEDYDHLMQWKWCARFSIPPGRIYAEHSVSVDRVRSVIGMHREVMGVVYGQKIDVDHINGNGLDNRRSNLRLATRQENNRNCRMKSQNKSGFKGVTFHAQSGRWRATIVNNYKQISLGLYVTPQEAHEAYCRAAIQYHGEFANFGSHQIKESNNEHHTSPRA